MPAHLRRLPTCYACDRPATQELRNTANALVGLYCERHAGPALERFLTAERRR